MRSEQGITRAMWANLYADLYRQVFGETATIEEIMADVAKRRQMIAYGEGHEYRRRPFPTPEQDRLTLALYDTYTEAELADQAATELWQSIRSAEE